VDHPLPWLRYVRAADLHDDAIDFDGLEVASPTGEHLGEVDGFIVDSESARPYYVVADAGGWFKSRHFLLPVGHARMDAGGEKLVADLSRDRIKHFPGFDTDNFQKLTPDDVKRLNDDVCVACAVEGFIATYPATEHYSAAWQRSDFQYPDWWRVNSLLQPRTDAGAIDDRAHPGDVIGIETSGERTSIGDTAEDERNIRRDVRH
jgi:hypothetical protein